VHKNVDLLGCRYVLRDLAAIFLCEKIKSLNRVIRTYVGFCLVLCTIIVTCNNMSLYIVMFSTLSKSRMLVTEFQEIVIVNYMGCSVSVDPLH